MEPIKVWEVLVPTCDNNGKTFPKSHHEEWDKHVCTYSGGLTIYNTVKGTWGTIKERLIPVRIACTEKQMKEIMEFTSIHYGQEEVMAWEISETVLRYKNEF